MSPQAIVTVIAFSLLPFATFLNDNKEQGLDPGQLLPYFLGVLVPVVLLLVLVRAVRGREAVDRAAVVVAAGLFVFFNFHTVGRPLGNGWISGFQGEIWVALAVVAAVGAYVLGRRAALRQYAFVVGVVLAAIPLVQYTAFRATGDSTAAPPSESTLDASAEAAGDLPNVYLFVLDGYGRGDQLEEHTGFDNDMFLNMLAKRGFEVADRAVASYPSTSFSIPSTLDMRYLVTKESDLASGGDRFHNRLRGENATVRNFKALGYRYAVAPPGGWTGTSCSGEEDLCIEPLKGPGLLGGLNETDWALLRMTPLEKAAKLLPGKISGPYNTPDNVLDTIERERLNAPFFVFSHMMYPHPPSRYDADCALTTSEGFKPDAPWVDEGYLGNLQCANKRMTTALERLLRRDPDAVVIIQGDHGTAFTFDLGQDASSWSKEEISERFSTLNAIRLPRRCRDSLHDAMPVINTFPRVFACLQGEDPKLLPVRGYIASIPGAGVARVPDRFLGAGADAGTSALRP